MKFSLGDEVSFRYSVKDGRTGSIVGIATRPEFLNPKNTAKILDYWSGLSGIEANTLANSPCYIVGLDEPRPPIDKQTAIKDYRSNFNSDEEFDQWYNNQAVKCVSAFEGDLKALDTTKACYCSSIDMFNGHLDDCSFRRP